jgi:putative CocE/NonD family hydrolase
MTTMGLSRLAVQTLFIALTISYVAVADAVDASAPLMDAQFRGYAGREVMIPMRDGVRLRAQVWRPANRTERLPILMLRSPYGFDAGRVGAFFDAGFKELADEGFILVLQDIRGRFGSEGEFVMLRPKAADPNGVDESTDAYDTIDWLVKSLPQNNGAVGMFGVSYGGWTTAMATIGAHPALKAISVQASPEDMFLGDDFFHNGAFRLSYGWEYAAALETDGRTVRPFDFANVDPYEWFLAQDDLARLDSRVIGRALPTWRNFVAHSTYDDFWRSRVTSTQMPPQPRVPNLIVAGWWDQEDFYGPLAIYRRQEQGDALGRNFLVIGPWNHGGWARTSGDVYGPFDLGEATAIHFRENVQLPWFRYWLKGEGVLAQPEALVFETGSDVWRRYAAWPPRNETSTLNLYLRSRGRLSFKPPRPHESRAARFVSDPSNPVPYRRRPIAALMSANTTWPTWLADDQAPFAARADVLFWQTEPLEEDVVVRGDVIARLFASTTGSDADWIVKLLDVFPTVSPTPPALRGRHRMIASEVLRGRFRASFERPQPLQPGKALDYTIDMHSASHVFRKGHRIGVQVQSTWFPLIDRNPQTFQPNIFEARGADFSAQTHFVFHSTAHPSSISIAVSSGVDDRESRPRPTVSEPLSSRQSLCWLQSFDRLAPPASLGPGDTVSEDCSV